MYQCSVMGLQVSHDSRRSILVDVLTVYGLGGKSIVFCERKRDADEVAAGVALAMPCEVGCLKITHQLQSLLGQVHMQACMCCAESRAG